MPSAVSVLYIVVTVSFAAAVILAYFVIAARKDWLWETRAFATIALTVGLILAPLTYPIYAAIDVLTRPKPTSQTKAVFVAIVFLLPGVGILAYFIWALQGDNRTEPRVPDPRRPMPVALDELQAPPLQVPLMDDGSRALTTEDLDYLQKLADLRSQGVVTDEQYDVQRRQRIGE